MFLDQPLTTNRWGMRGRDYSLAKPEGTFRIVLLGPSHLMGAGVADGETIADFLEARLNRSAESAGGVRFEVLNFGVAGYSLLQQLSMLEQRAVMFQPDAVLITDSPRLDAPIVSHLLAVVSARVAIPFADIDSLVRRTGVTALTDQGIPVPSRTARALFRRMGIATRMPWSEADRQLRLKIDDIIRLTLGQIAQVAREAGAEPVFVALDNVLDPPEAEVGALRDAAAAGFLVFDLLGLWEGRDKPSLRIAAWDDHPNAAGNRVIADRLFTLLQQHRAALKLGASAEAPRVIIR